MSARGAWEFDFNAALAKAVYQALQGRGVHAFLIGDKGDMTSLTRRTALAREGGATFFLSIHHDSAQPQYFQSWNWQGTERHYADRFSGYSLFVSRKNPDVNMSLRCASMLGAELQKAGMHSSPHHAEPIQGESREWADQRHGVYYYDNLAVLRTATMPAMLLEAGVIVNRDEEVLLQSPAMRETIATAVVRGLADCGAINVRPGIENPNAYNRSN